MVHLHQGLQDQQDLLVLLDQLDHQDLLVLLDQPEVKAAQDLQVHQVALVLPVDLLQDLQVHQGHVVRKVVRVRMVHLDQLEGKAGLGRLDQPDQLVLQVPGAQPDHPDLADLPVHLDHLVVPVRLVHLDQVVHLDLQEIASADSILT